MNILRNFLIGCFLIVPSISLAQTTQAINLSVQDFAWSVNFVAGSVPVTPHHYDFVCNKTGVTTPIRKALAVPPGEVNLTAMFVATDAGVYSCWAEAMTSTNTLIARSKKDDGTDQNIGFELYVETVSPNQLKMKFRVR